MWERNISGEQKRTLMSQTYIMVTKWVLLCRKLVNILSLWNNKPRFKISSDSLGFIKLEQKMVNLTRVFHNKVRFHNAFEFQKLEQALVFAVFRAFRDSPVVSLFLRFSHRKNVDLFMCFLCPKGLEPLFAKWYTLLHIPHYCIVSAGGMKWGIAENYDWCKRNSLCLVLRNLLMTMDLWERDSTTLFRKKNEKKSNLLFRTEVSIKLEF